MRWLVAPAADRPVVRRVVSRLDAMLGLPRVHAAEETIRHGSGPHAAAVLTETQVPVMLHDDSGAAALHGAIAFGVDDVVNALRERFVDVGGVRKRIREWIADRGWELRAELPGAALAWSHLPPRDGAPGSVDGSPIPEGDE